MQYGSFHKIREPKYRSQSSRALVIRTPTKKGPQCKETASTNPLTMLPSSPRGLESRAQVGGVGFAGQPYVFREHPGDDALPEEHGSNIYPKGPSTDIMRTLGFCRDYDWGDVRNYSCGLSWAKYSFFKYLDPLGKACENYTCHFVVGRPRSSEEDPPMGVESYRPKCNHPYHSLRSI